MITIFSIGDWFEPPEDCALRQVCSETGLTPGPYCVSLATDYFIPLISSTTDCRHMQEIKVSADETISYCSNCAPANGYKKKMYPIVAPEMREYYLTGNKAFEKLPPHNTECEIIFKGNGPNITSPVNGNEYYINKRSPEPLQLAASAGDNVNKFYWYVNDKFYKTTTARDKQFFIPDEGPVKISCTDDKGRNRNIWIKVRYVDL